MFYVVEITKGGEAEFSVGGLVRGEKYPEFLSFPVAKTFSVGLFSNNNSAEARRRSLAGSLWCYLRESIATALELSSRWDNNGMLTAAFFQA